MTRISGVLSPVVTPFNDDMSPDAERFVRHCRWLVANNVGLAVFGTNSEANSLAADEPIKVKRGVQSAAMEEVLLLILGGDEAEAAIGDDLLDGTGGHV